MSRPENPSNDSTLRGNNSAKRGACDRCRGQKLRCLPNEASRDSTCIRCFKAGAICSFGKPKRLGRPPASSTNASRERRDTTSGKSRQGSAGNGGAQAGIFDGKAGVSWDSGQFVRNSAIDEASDGEADDTVTAYQLNPSSIPETSSNSARTNLNFSPFSTSSATTLPWSPGETLPPFFEDGSAETSGLDTFGSKYNWAFQHQQVQPTNLHIMSTTPRSDDEHSRNMALGTFGGATKAQIAQVSDESMDLDVPSQATPVEPINSLSAQQSNRENAWASSNPFSLDPITKSKSFNDVTGLQANINRGSENLTSPQDQHRRMQELSELAMDLYMQLAAQEFGKQQQDMASSFSSTAEAIFDTQLFGNVLKSSSTFLTLLVSFASSNGTTRLKHQPHSYTSTCTSSDNGASPPASTRGDPDSTDSLPVIPLTPSPSGTTTSATQTPPPTDMTTILQLLTCYIRLIHLHSIMYTHLLSYTRTFLPSSPKRPNPIPPVFPNLQIGGACLDNFGALQISFLLQVTVHMLGEIEIALGLPAEYRVGKRKGGGMGVLEASVSGEFVTCLMREGAWSEKRVESMRVQLSALKEGLGVGMEF